MQNQYIKPAESLSNSPYKSVHHIFEAQVQATPNNLAVIFNNTRLTYLQINQAANKVAHFLTDHYQIRVDTPVGIMLERSEKMIIGILAILKAGGAYVPLDPENPIERSAFICSDCDIKVILCDHIPENGNTVVGVNFVELNDPSYFKESTENLSLKVDPSSLAYIIYTSGSTGKPKGVMIEHRSVCNKLSWMQDQFGLTAKDTMLQKTNFAFDVSVWELFWPLLNGARLSFLNPGDQKYPGKILEIIARDEVTMVHFVPAMLRIFLDYLALYPAETDKLQTVKRVFASGEALTPRQVNLFNSLVYKTSGTGLTNQYGPTEAAIEVTCFNCESHHDVTVVPIGKPIKNTRLYVISPDGVLLPPGETGELVIAGIQVARGYINRPGLTAERFAPDPYYPGERIYTTGDLGRYLPAGDIEFLGRIDDQVQVNGNRIEPGEIQNAILNNAAIKDSIVVATDKGGFNTLVAYLVFASPFSKRDGLVDNLVNGLKKTLPAYMVPSFFVELDAIPVNGNGKTDYQSLPVPTERYHFKEAVFTAPRNLTEKIIAGILATELGISTINIDESFFDLGGHSLMAVCVIVSINDRFQTGVSLSTLFRFPTIRQLSAYLDGNKIETVNPVVLLREGTGPALILFPGRWGNPHTFKHFLQVYPSGQPIYSVSYPEGNMEFKYTHPGQYAAYITENIKQLCPDGPYSLLGYSLGGKVAFAVAAQLQRNGDEVNFLSIVSSPAHDPVASFKPLSKAMWEVSAFFKIPFSLKLKYMANRIPFFLNVAFAKSSTKAVNVDTLAGDTDIMTVHQNIAELFEIYDPATTFNGDILLLKESHNHFEPEEYANREVYLQQVNTHLGWRNLVNGRIAIGVLKCSHTQIFSQQNVAQVASFIQANLNQQAVEVQELV